MSRIDLSSVDIDGAIREAQDAVAGDTRADFFRKAAIGGGAVVSSGAIMGMLPTLASARPSRKQDIAILNFALTLEYLEAAFYKQAVAKVNFGNQDARDFAKLVAEHEKIHVQTLKSVLKSNAVKSPKFDFGQTVTNEAKFIETAFVLENTGVHAYLGQAGNLKSNALLAAAASIVTIEARHAAAIAIILNNSPYTLKGPQTITPDGAFDVAYSKRKILKAVAGTGFIKG